MVTLKDIAKKAGVSITSVSRLLNNDETLYLTNEKKELIYKIVDELGYKSPKKRNSKYKIGYVYWKSMEHELNDVFYLEIRHSLEKYSKKNKVTLQYLYKENNKYNYHLLEKLDGIIAVGKFSQLQIDTLANINENIVFVDENSIDLAYDCVVADYAYGMRQIFKYAKEELDVNNLGFITGLEYTDDNQMVNDLRYLEYNRLINEDSYFKDSKVYQDEFSVEHGYNSVNELIKNKQLPKLLITGNELINVGVLRALYENRIYVPEDVKIICFSGNKEIENTTPSITSITTSTEQLGYEALDLILRMNKEKSVTKKIMLAPELIIRSST